MLYIKRPQVVEAVKFEGQEIPGMTPSAIWDGEWEIRYNGVTVNARLGDYIYLRDGKATGSAAPRFFEQYYLPVE